MRGEFDITLHGERVRVFTRRRVNTRALIVFREQDTWYEFY